MKFTIRQANCVDFPLSDMKPGSFGLLTHIPEWDVDESVDNPVYCTYDKDGYKEYVFLATNATAGEEDVKDHRYRPLRDDEVLVISNN